MKTVAITSTQVTDYLAQKGWTVDSYDNLKKTIKEKLYRIKLQSNSVRIEVQATIDASQYSKEEKIWVRLGGEYYKNISFTESGKMKIGKHLL